MPQHLSKPVVRSSPRTVTPRPNNKKPSTYSRMTSNSVDDHFNDSVLKKKSGVSDSKLFLLFLEGARKLVECRVCENVIYPGDEVRCSVQDCGVAYHLRCANDRFGLLRSLEKFKCPQHACYHCKKKLPSWRCGICDLASHDKCAAFPEYVVRSNVTPGKIICWRHSSDSPSLKHAAPASSIEEVFRRLPLPYTEKEFSIDLTMVDNAVPASSIKEVFRRLQLSLVEKEFTIDRIRKNTKGDSLKPPSYVKIKKNTYLTKKEVDEKEGCTICGFDICPQECICRCLNISCSSVCKCSENCTNRPFQEAKKIKLIKTQDRGWGVEAAELINEGDFIIEYVGEVLDEAICEKRLWDMKAQGVTNFYMVSVRKDFTIDASVKGNESRFVNHSCDPNCDLQQWDVSGMSCLGIFANKSIEPGEELTFDYRFELYGKDVKCCCGASNCRGHLGIKKKTTPKKKKTK